MFCVDDEFSKLKEKLSIKLFSKIFRIVITDNGTEFFNPIQKNKPIKIILYFPTRKHIVFFELMFYNLIGEWIWLKENNINLKLEIFIPLILLKLLLEFVDVENPYY